VATRGRRSGLNTAAESIGRTLGHVANRLDKLARHREAITAEIQHLAKSATEMLSTVRSGVEAEVAVVTAAVKRGRKAGFKMSKAARRKMSIAAKKRHAASKKAAKAAVMK
jgi:hypothetical protein